MRQTCSILVGDDEDSSDDEEDDDAPGPEVDPRLRSAGRASTRSALLTDEDDEALAVARMNSDDDDDGEDSDDATVGRRGADDDAGRQAAGGALGAAIDPNDEASICGSLFRGCVFFLSREVPREPLMFVVRAFGGAVAWDGEGSPFTEASEAITHQVIYMSPLVVA